MERQVAKVATGLLLALFSACGPSWSERGGVDLEASGFTMHGSPFFPMVLNYEVSIRAVGDSIWVGAGVHYASFDPSAIPDRESCRRQLRADMTLIAELGFNTVRLVGFSHMEHARDSIWLNAWSKRGGDTLIHLVDKGAYARYLSALDDMLAAVREAGLRAIMLTELRPDRPLTEDQFARIADHFVNDTVILAYDLFNEPLYFDRIERPKEEAFRILRHWRRVFDAHAPNQLYTLGLTGIRETFEFDPNMLGVDFISFHPYEYEPDQVRNELRWYHNNVDVPWIIGETAIPADDDSVPYTAQFEFAQRTLLQGRACGALGYSWWQYQDVRWGKFHSDLMGVLNREGTTTTTKEQLQVNGTIKPVAKAFQQFDPWTDAGECVCLPNSLNYSEGRVCKITGRLVDVRGQPINEGTVLGWNEHWTASYHTITGPDGRFELRGPEWLYHWMASATRYSMDRGDSDPNGCRRGADGIPAYELGDIVLERLTFVD